MDMETLRNYCLAKKGVIEDLPFDELTLVFKVMGKLFALTNLNSENFTVNLKCDPEWAEDLRADHEEVQPGYHMSKKHWNTVQFDGDLEVALLKKMIDHSYDLVVKGLSKKDREALKEL